MNSFFSFLSGVTLFLQTTILPSSSVLKTLQYRDKPSPPPAIITHIPTPSIIESPPVSPMTTLAPTFKPYSPTTIDCVGPDKKHFRTTQKECDAFNNAWAKKPTQAPTSSSTTLNGLKSSSPQSNLINCTTKSGSIRTTQASCNAINNAQLNSTNNTNTYMQIMQNK